jgi:hypothetical protein
VTFAIEHHLKSLSRMSSQLDLDPSTIGAVNADLQVALTLGELGSDFFKRPRSERTAVQFDRFLVDDYPSDWNVIQNHANPPLDLWLCHQAKRAVAIGAGIGINDLIGNPNEASTLRPILQELNHVPFFTGNGLFRESALVVRISRQ